jgi:hypothetical protein
LPLSVTSIAVRLLALRIPPPPSRPTLFSTRAWLSVSVASFKMPPAKVPAPEKPLRTVNPWIVTFPAVSRMSKIRSFCPPSMIVAVAPAPVIVTGPVMSRSPVAAASSPAPITVRLKVPAGTVIASAPELAFAARTASRSVHPPVAVVQTPSVPSAVVLTTKVSACAGTACSTSMVIATAPTTRAHADVRARSAEKLGNVIIFDVNSRPEPTIGARESTREGPARAGASSPSGTKYSLV